jgi:Novel toxin 10
MVDTDGLYPVYFFTHEDGSVTYSATKQDKNWKRYTGEKRTFTSSGLVDGKTAGIRYTVTKAAIRRLVSFTSSKPPVEKANDSNQLDKQQRAFIAGADQGAKDSVSGSAKGTANTGIGLINTLMLVAWNAASSNSTIGSLNSAGIIPQIERYGYNSDIEARHGIAFEVGLNVAPGVAGGVFANSSRFSFVSGASDVSNPIPNQLARVIAGDGTYSTLGRPGTTDVFVTAADDIVGLNATELSTRLGIPPSEAFTVFEFATPSSGLASPILRQNPGFVGFGRTSGGAREFIIPNGPIPADAIIRRVGQ